MTTSLSIKNLPFFVLHPQSPLLRPRQRSKALPLVIFLSIVTGGIFPLVCFCLRNRIKVYPNKKDHINLSNIFGNVTLKKQGQEALFKKVKEVNQSEVEQQEEDNPVDLLGVEVVEEQKSNLEQNELDIELPLKPFENAFNPNDVLNNRLPVSTTDQSESDVIDFLKNEAKAFCQEMRQILRKKLSHEERKSYLDKANVLIKRLDEKRKNLSDDNPARAEINLWIRRVYSVGIKKLTIRKWDKKFAEHCRLTSTPHDFQIQIGNEWQSIEGVKKVYEWSKAKKLTIIQLPALHQVRPQTFLCGQYVLYFLLNAINPNTSKIAGLKDEPLAIRKEFGLFCGRIAVHLWNKRAVALSPYQGIPEELPVKVVDVSREDMQVMVRNYFKKCVPLPPIAIVEIENAPPKSHAALPRTYVSPIYLKQQPYQGRLFLLTKIFDHWYFIIRETDNEHQPLFTVKHSLGYDVTSNLTHFLEWETEEDQSKLEIIEGKEPPLAFQRLENISKWIISKMEKGEDITSVDSYPSLVDAKSSASTKK